MNIEARIDNVQNQLCILTGSVALVKQLEPYGPWFFSSDNDTSSTHIREWF